MGIDTAMTPGLRFLGMVKNRADNFSMRLNDQDRQDWEEGAKLFAQLTGTDENISAFLRVAAREKLQRMKDEVTKAKVRRG